MQPVALQRELARLARTARAARELLDELEHTVWVLRASMEADAEPGAGAAPNPTSSPAKQQVTAQATTRSSTERESAPK
ncbi:MAG TPA: hypothetical protein VML75_22080 [Kofleriaceae bacterium]|nr:hypothetical protein [Kofleriaceae bacterium]